MEVGHMKHSRVTAVVGLGTAALLALTEPN